jgi:hypothetical protein
MRRRLPLASLVLVALAACGGNGSTATSTSGGPTASQATATADPTAAPSTSSVTGSPTPEPTTVPVLPAGVPPTYGRDVPSGDVPLKALVPKGSRVEGSWYATTSAGDAIVVAYAQPSGDPFRAERGFVVWRRFADAPPWRALYGVDHPAEDSVMTTQVLTEDLTGDGSPDALVNEVTGGSGSCGIWRVLDLASGAEIWRRSLCDAQIAPSVHPVGLEITEAVYAPGDAHCCPSAFRTTVLTYAGDERWTVASKTVTPTGT